MFDDISMAVRSHSFPHLEAIRCQSALDWDPRSASKGGSDAILVKLRLFRAD
jgi:hypothetical protein